MVPGLYLYRAIYNFGIMALSDAVSWFASAIMIIIALPLGLIFARILTDKTLGIAHNRIIHIISRLVYAIQISYSTSSAPTYKY